MLIECPHCFSRVIPMSDERCPSCLGDTRVAKVRSLSSVQLRAGATLPDVCVHCGNVTADRVEVRRERSTGGESGLIRLLVMMWSPIWYALLRRDLHGETRDVLFRIPVCSLCARLSRPIQPKFVNFEHRTMTLIVHSNFATALAARPNVGAADGDSAA